MCLCLFRGRVWYLWVEWDYQLHAVVGNEGCDVFFCQLPILWPQKVCSALIKLANTQFHLRQEISSKSLHFSSVAIRWQQSRHIFTFLKSTTALPFTSYFWNTSGLDDMANS